MRPALRAFGPALLLAALTTPATAATIWDEMTNGDLSGNGLTPTTLNLTAGSNKLIGTTGVPFIGLEDGLPVFGEVDRDYFTITIAQGQQLDSMLITNRNSPPGNDTFLGIEIGPAVTEATDAVIPSKLWGYLLYGDLQFNRTTRVGSNLLAQIFDLKNNKVGIGPLGPGTYSFWTQDTLNGALIDYEFDFRVSQAAPVPVPAAWVLMTGSLAVLGSLRRRRADA
jgi:hypothetical protein